MKNLGKTLAMSLGFMVLGLLACIYGVILGNELTMTLGGILLILGLVTVDN